MTKPKPKVALCSPTMTRPFEPFLASVEASIPALEAAGFDHKMTWEIGCPYISSARATMLRKALDWRADIIVFLDHDLSFPPEALVKLIQTEGNVVAGTYRFKQDEESYMGRLHEDEQGRPIVREDGCVRAQLAPAGFLKITSHCVNHFMGCYPELVFGPRHSPSVDLFNHGAHDGVWWGEDYAFCRRWEEAGGEIWTVPDLDLTHHTAEQAFPGNFHRWLLRVPGPGQRPPSNNERASA